MHNRDERSQVEAAQRDPAQFAALYDGHFYRVYAYVVRRVENRTLAEDLTAQVFHEALANLAHSSGAVSSSPWVIFHLPISDSACGQTSKGCMCV